MPESAEADVASIVAPFLLLQSLGLSQFLQMLEKSPIRLADTTLTLNGHLNIMNSPEIVTPDKEDNPVEASFKYYEIFAKFRLPIYVFPNIIFPLHNTCCRAACQYSATSQSVNQVGETKSVPSMSISVNCLYK